MIDAIGGTTRYSYDLMSNLTGLTDAKGNKTGFEYDTMNRVSRVVYPGGAAEVFSYDDNGRLEAKTDRKAVTTTYSYDAMNRLLGKTYSDGVTPAVTYTYDNVGRLLTAANGTDTLTWTYDLAGQLLTEQSTKNSSTVAYTYDNGGNRATVSLDGSLFVTYGYDDASRLTSITRGSNVFGFGYDNANRRTSMTYPNGVNTAYTYDNLNRLLRLKADKGATPITDFQYLYDNAGNRTRKQQLDYTEDYTYDPLYRLTGAQRSAGGTGLWQWTYDAVGNRLTNQLDNSVTTSAYNEKNQLTGSAGGGPLRWRGSLNEPGSVTFTSALVNGKPAKLLQGNAFEAVLDMTSGNNTVTVQATDVSGNVTTKNYQVNASGASATYTYDPNGNLATKVEGADTWGYEWNPENQLTRVTKNAVEQARFKYDPIGRRVERVAGVITAWVHDAKTILRESVGGTVTNYVGGVLIDEPLASEGAGVLTYLHGDALGSIITKSTQAGSPFDAIQYNPWGQGTTDLADSKYAFNGREWDSAAGLYQYRARWYDHRLGRFISEDPRGFIDGPNVYQYVSSNPPVGRDPSGTTWGDATTCARNPSNWYACAWTGLCWASASSIERKLNGGDTSNNDRNNAIKHCFWSCCIAYHTSWTKAIEFTNGHESDERYTSPCSSEMDRWNNHIGAGIGEAMSKSPWDSRGDCFHGCKRNSSLQCEPRKTNPFHCQSAAF